MIYRCLDLFITEYGIDKSLLKEDFPDLVMHLLWQNVTFQKQSWGFPSSLHKSCQHCDTAFATSTKDQMLVPYMEYQDTFF